MPTFSITYLPKHFPIYYIVITEVGRFAKLIFLNEKPIHYPIYTFQHFDRIFNGKLLIGDLCTNVDNFLFRRNFPLYYTYSSYIDVKCSESFWFRNVQNNWEFLVLSKLSKKKFAWFFQYFLHILDTKLHTV